MRKVLPVALLAIGLSSPTCSFAAETAGNNGRWSVELVTESGVCSAHYSYAVAIREGYIQPLSGHVGAKVSGRVDADGRIGLSVSNGTATGTGTGRLAAGTGSGTWTVASLCSGSWTARRSDDRTARAD